MTMVIATALIALAALINLGLAIWNYRRASAWATEASKFATEARKFADDMRHDFIAQYGYDPIKAPRAPAPNPPSIVR